MKLRNDHKDKKPNLNITCKQRSEQLSIKLMYYENCKTFANKTDIL